MIVPAYYLDYVEMENANAEKVMMELIVQWELVKINVMEEDLVSMEFVIALENIMEMLVKH